MNTKSEIRIKDIVVKIYRKNIKHIHLNVLPTDGEVRISAPLNVPDAILKTFLIKKYSWIKKHINAFKEQERQTERRFISGESHYLRGNRYILKVEKAKKPRIEIRNKKYILFFVPTHYSTKQKEKYYENWLRKELKEDLKTLVPKWEKIIGIKTKEIRIKKMKTKWGSCNANARRIWLNLELIKKPPKCLEYVIAHELVHLIEQTHNQTFKYLLNKYLPKWKTYKKQLNEFIL